ncbi:MAG: hypothetical protein WAW96_08240 [Alphaproteobacteria bacterium]
MTFVFRLLIVLAALTFGAQPVLCAEMPLQPTVAVSDPCHHSDQQQPQMPGRCPHQLAGMHANSSAAAVVPSLAVVSYFVPPLIVAPPSKITGRRIAADSHLPFRLRTLVADRTLLRI